MNRIIEFLKRNKYSIINGLIPLFLFTIVFLAYYPGIISYDSANQWQQVQTHIITDSHPFFSTFFMLLLSKIHNTTTIVLMFHIVMFSLIWGYFCKLTESNKRIEIIKIVFTIFISALPIMSLYSITLWKDILYSYYLFMISVLFYKGIKYSFNYKIYDYIMFGIILFLINSYRHNGILVVVMFFVLAIIAFFKISKKIKKAYMKGLLVCITTFFIATLIVLVPKNYYLNRSTRIIEKEKTKDEKETKVPLKTNYVLWMLGAHIKNNNINDKKDIVVLDNVLDIKRWKEIYNPYIINTITSSSDINGKYVNDNTDKIISIFIKYTKKYPGTIILHYLRSDALLIDPISQMHGYLYIFDFSEYKPYGFKASTISKLPHIQKGYDMLINISMKSPMKYLYQPALMLYLSLILSFILSKKVYDRRIYLFITPMLFNTISLLPINLAQDLRYAYINFIVFFGILLLFIINYKKIFVKNKKKMK